MESAADGIAFAQSAVSAERLTGCHKRVAKRIRVLAKLIGRIGFEAFAGFGTAAGLTALMLKAAVRIEIVILGIALAAAATVHPSERRQR
jgi:hypothetical protein